MITVAGLGPGGLERIPGTLRDLLMDEDVTLIVRTLDHPAARELADARTVVTCDDLYERSATFEEVYEGIVGRVMDSSRVGPVVYAVPGSPLVGERTVQMLMAGDAAVGLIPGESFIDAVLAEVGYDPLERGLQVLNAHDLPDPLVLDKPTLIGQLDRPEILADVSASVARVLVEDAEVTVVVDAGTPQCLRRVTDPSSVESALAGSRTTMFVDAAPGGLVGAVATMRALRARCPWDRDQTHHSLIKNLVEETHELVDALTRLPAHETDWAAYSAVEDELGDVLLQVLFHEAIARETGVFDIDDVAETLRQKLVRRHPHVFADTEAATPDQVKENWDRIKEGEGGQVEDDSILAGVPVSMPALHRAAKMQNRAAKVGFDWNRVEDVLRSVVDELEELKLAISGEDGGALVETELGDVLFSIVNVARHLEVDPEMALRRAIDKFETRFRAMEAEGPLSGLGLDELNRRWERVKGS